MAKCVRTRSLPALKPRRNLPPLKDEMIASFRKAERGADFWEGVEGFTRREEALRKDVGTSSTSSLHKPTALSSDDMHMLVGMGYKGPLFLSLMNRSTKELLVQKQAVGNLKQFRAAVRTAELHVGFDDPVVKRMRGCLKDADTGIRALKQDGENTQTLTDVMNRVRNLDIGRQVWDDPVLAAGRDRYMTWRVSGLQSPKAQTRKASCAALAALGSASSPLQAASLARVQHPASKYASDLGSLFNDPSYDVRQAAINACLRIGDAGTKVVLTQLESLEPRARRAACEALGNMGENGAVYADLLAARLGDSDAEVRTLACRAFENFAMAGLEAGKRYAAAVAATLHDKSARVRLASCCALGSMGEVAAYFISNFGMLMEDENEDVRVSASNALRRLGAEGLATLHAAEARLAAAAISKNKEASTKEDRLEAIEALSAMRDNSKTEDAALHYLNDVAACFTDENAEVRKAAILAFQNFSTDESANALADDVAKNLDDEDEVIRIAAVNSLMTMSHGTEDHLNAVVDLLDDPNEDVRKAVIEAMGNSAEANPSTTRHIMKLAHLTKGDCKETQEAAENALANMGQGGRAISSAMRMDSEDENVRLAAIEAMSELNLFKVSAAEQRRREESLGLLQLPLFGVLEEDEDDDLFGPSRASTQRSQVPSQPVSARSRGSPMPSPVVQLQSPSSARSQNSSEKNEEEPLSPVSPSTSLKFSAARTWRRGALLARAVSGFGKAGAIDSSPKTQQDVRQSAEDREQDDWQPQFVANKSVATFKRQIEPEYSTAFEDLSDQSPGSPKSPNVVKSKAKPLRSVRFQEEPIKAEELPVTTSEDVDSPQSLDSPKSPFSPKRAWGRGLRGVVAEVKAHREQEETESVATGELGEDELLEREAKARGEEAFGFQTKKTRGRKQGELGKFLKDYGRGDPFAKELLEAKEGKEFEGKTEFSALDSYLGAPERCAEYNEILHIAFVGLVSRLRDPSELQRAAACNAFCTFNANAEDVAPVVGPLLWDEVSEVHLAARHCLVCIGGSGIDLINRYDREKRAKRKQGICRYIVESWIRASPPYIELWAPRDTAFKVDEPAKEAAEFQTAVYFQVSGNDALKTTQLDTSDYKQYMLASDNPDFQLSAKAKEKLKKDKFKFHTANR